MKPEEQIDFVKQNQKGEEAFPERVTPKNILVVEDNKTNQKILVTYLNRRGYYPSIANDGLEAVQLYEKQLFDIVFMDIEMPVMGGLEATQKIRVYEQKTHRTPAIIIGLSGNAQPKQTQKALDAGMNDYLTKPYHSKNLYEKIERYKNNMNSMCPPPASQSLTNLKPVEEISIQFPFWNKSLQNIQDLSKLRANLPNTDIILEFEEHSTISNGNCGFITLGVDRQTLTTTLLALKNNPQACEFLAEEIVNAFVTFTATQGEEGLVPPEIDKWIKLIHQRDNDQQILDVLFRKIRDSLTDETSKTLPLDTLINELQAHNKVEEAQALIKQQLQLSCAERGLEDYCKQPAIFDYYIKALGTSTLWLGYKSALLYAKQDEITLYVWRKDEQASNWLKLIDYHDSGEAAKNVIHMLHTAGFTHFNFLSLTVSQQEVLNFQTRV